MLYRARALHVSQAYLTVNYSYTNAEFLIFYALKLTHTHTPYSTNMIRMILLILQHPRLLALFRVCYWLASLGAESLVVAGDTCGGGTERSAGDAGDCGDKAQCGVEFGSGIPSSRKGRRVRHGRATDWWDWNATTIGKHGTSVADVETGLWGGRCRRLAAEEGWSEEDIGVARR